jgi:hypothetical protein
MKRFLAVSILAACVLALAPAIQAQDCSSLTNWDLRGTYAMYGSGWNDFSKVITAPPPGVTLPSGSIPTNWIGVYIFNGKGGGSGWIATNAGGMQLTLDLMNLTYAVKPDCSVQTSFSMKIRELGITVGPVARLLVIAGTPSQMELFGMLVGGGPGTGGDSMTVRRISVQYWQ